MTGPSHAGRKVWNGALAELVDWAKSRLPQLTQVVLATVRDLIDLYRDGQVVPLDDLRRSVELNLRVLIDSLANSSIAQDMAVPAETGRRRAHQGAPLPEVLRVYRIGCAMLWNSLVEQARRKGRPDAMDAIVDAASLLWQITDDHALVLTEAYRATTAEMLIAQQQRRSALVEALLTGELTTDAGPWEAGKLLGLPLDARFAVIAAETRSLAEESLYRVERRLAEIGVVSAWHLTPTLQTGVVSIPSGRENEIMVVLRDAARARAGVSPPYRSLVDTPRALHLARAALASLPPGRVGVRLFSLSPLAALVVNDPDEGQRLAEAVFGPLLDLPRDDRSTLLTTLHAFLENAGSSERAAGVLRCHPNTVRYRLRRLRELTGRSLADPISLAELATAAEALRLRHSGPSSTVTTSANTSKGRQP